jgi:tetratricopeptide (TPR) repeat protein
MTAESKYRAFLSYSHKDRKVAGRLHRELERYRVPNHLSDSGNSEQVRNLRPIFRDRDELSSGIALHEVIENALNDSDSLIVVCSPAALDSKWVNDEIQAFQRLGKGNRIFCFIIAGTPLIGDEQECFPEALRHPVGIDGQLLENPDEPIAANASGGKGEWRHAKLMLIAGLLGVGLDRLLQRDHQRRNSKLFAIASGSIVLTIIMAGLAVYAYLSQAEATRRQADADNLVGYLLGDLQNQLYTIGRTELYNEVSRKALEYFNSLEKDDARDEVLAQRAVALLQIGSSMMDLGEMQDAMKVFYEALTINQRLVKENPHRDDWKLELSESHYYIGDVYWQRGDLDAASEEFQKQLLIVDELVIADPDNPEKLRNSGYGWTNYGRILELSGRFDESLVAYLAVMDAFQRMLALDPLDPDLTIEVGFAHNNLGKLKTSLGLLENAEEHLRSDLEFKLNISALEPENNMWLGYVASSHTWLARILQIRGNFPEAYEQLEFAHETLNFQLRNNPNANGPRKLKTSVNRLLAANCRIRMDSSCASENITASLADLDKLTSSNPENARLLHDQARSQLEFAWQAQLRGDHEIALDYAQKAEQTTGMLVTQAPTNLELRKSEILMALTLGDFARQTSKFETARSYWEFGLNILEDHFTDTADPRILDVQMQLLSRTNQISEAQGIEQKLSQTTYSSPYPWP